MPSNLSIVVILGLGSRVTKFDNGTAPPFVGIRNWSNSSIILYSSGNLTLISTSSSELSGLYLSTNIPLVTN